MRQPVVAFVLAAALLTVGWAQAQTAVRLRGTLTAVDGDVLSVRSREGEPLTVKLAEGASIAVAKLLFEFKGGSQRILVPEGVPLVRAVPGGRADLKPGEYVFAVVQKAADGSLSVPRIQVSKDGVRPPQ